MSWLTCTTRIGSGIVSPPTCLGKPFPFQRSNVNESASRTPGPKSSRRDEHVGHLAPGCEVVDCPFVGGFLQHPHDLVALLVGAAGRGEREDVAHDLGGIAAVVDERLRADGDLVAEQCRDLVRVPRAADVPQQRNPVGVLAHLPIEPRGLAHPRREEARAQLRLERLTEGVVLRQRERGDELAQAKRCLRNGESSRCIRRPAHSTLCLSQGGAAARNRRPARSFPRRQA